MAAAAAVGATAVAAATWRRGGGEVAAATAEATATAAVRCGGDGGGRRRRIPPPQPTARLLARSITEPCSWSPRTWSCSVPNMDSTKEKTRSQGAELGRMEKAMRAACAQLGILDW